MKKRDKDPKGYIHDKLERELEALEDVSKHLSEVELETIVDRFEEMEARVETILKKVEERLERLEHADKVNHGRLIGGVRYGTDDEADY